MPILQMRKLRLIEVKDLPKADQPMSCEAGVPFCCGPADPRWVISTVPHQKEEGG